MYHVNLILHQGEHCRVREEKRRREMFVAMSPAIETPPRFSQGPSLLDQRLSVAPRWEDPLNFTDFLHSVVVPPPSHSIRE